MKQKLCALLLSASMLSSLAVPAFAVDAAETNAPPSQTPGEDVVYLGVENYGKVTRDEKETFKHRFFVDGAEKTFTIPADGGKFEIQNKLQEGYIYDVTIEDGQITAAEMEEGDVAGVLTKVWTDDDSDWRIKVDNESFTINKDAELYDITSKAGGATVQDIKFNELKQNETVRIVVDSDDHVTKLFRMFIAEDYTAPVSGVPGKQTLKNFLATAMEPVGTALYVYGGTWDWQDVNSSNQAMTIGLSQSWIDFFQSQDANYTYKNSANPSESYYPHNAWNQYYYAGIDCSAFVGWSVYNTMHTTNGSVANGDKGYVMSATQQAKNFANEQGWGTWEQKAPFKPEDFKTGDIFSMNGHVWICLGKCEDGSLVILHSTPSDSINGQGGGGVQINGVGDSENCQAVKLAEEYMSKYYPQWWKRYHKVYKNFDDYTEYSGSAAGKFSWTLGGTLTDPDGNAKMSADELLAALFKGVTIPQQTTEAVYLGVENYGTVTKNEKESFKHRFFIDGDIKTYTIPADGGKFEFQNQLQEG